MVKFFYRLLNFFNIKHKYSYILFKNSFLKVIKAVEPELLLWENFGATKKNRTCRKIIFVFILITTLVIVFYAVLGLELIN
jgi:hypothetical protein